MSVIMMLGLSLAWGAVVVCVGAGLQRLGLTGAMRQLLWRVAGALMLAPFAAAAVYELLGPNVVDPFWTWGEGGAPRVPVVVDPQVLQRSAAAPVTTTTTPGVDWSMSGILGSVIAMGWFVRAVLARRAAAELSLVTRKSEPVRSRAVIDAADAWSRRLGLSATPSLNLMDGDFSPFTQGVRRPVVYLPHGLEARLSAREMDLVIGHELMHVRRGDAVWRPFERSIADLLWFNPFAWFIRDELERARELACDEAMIARDAPGSMYARALVSVARFAAGLPTQAPAAAMFPFDKDKVLPERVKAATTPRARSSHAALLGLCVFAVGGIPLAIAQGAGAPKQRLPIPDFVATVITLENARVSSTFGERPDPLTKKQAWHSGVDVAAPEGTPVYAPADAEVVHADQTAGYGKLIKLRFNAEWYGKFGQLSDYNVKQGDRVRAGDVIGYVGETGRANGPHLHMEILGPSASFDRNGELAAFDPQHMGVAMIPSQELNAAQIRKLGVVLPTPVEAKPVEGRKVAKKDGQTVETYVETKDGKVLHRVIRRTDNSTGQVVEEFILPAAPQGGVRVVVGDQIYEGDRALKLLKKHGAISKMSDLDGMVLDLDVGSMADLSELGDLRQVGQAPQPPMPPLPPQALEGGPDSKASAWAYRFDDAAGIIEKAELEAMRIEARQKAAAAREASAAAREAAAKLREASAKERQAAARMRAKREMEMKAHTRLDDDHAALDHSDLEDLIEDAVEEAMLQGMDDGKMEAAIGAAIAGLVDVTLSATSQGLDAAADAMAEMDMSDMDISFDLNGKTMDKADRAEIEASLIEIESEIKRVGECLSDAKSTEEKLEARIELAALKTARSSLNLALSAMH